VSFGSYCLRQLLQGKDTDEAAAAAFELNKAIKLFILTHEKK